MDDKLYAEMQAEIDLWYRRCCEAQEQLHRLRMRILLAFVPVAFVVGSLIHDWLVR